MQIELDWDGQAWALDTEEVTLTQAFVIKDGTKDGGWPSGRPLQPWLAGVMNGDPACVRALYWLMLQQNGDPQPLGRIPDDFPVMKFYSTYTNVSAMAGASAAQLRRMLEETEKALTPIRTALELAEAKEAAEAAAEEEAGPTQPPATAPAASAPPPSRRKRASTAAQGG